VEATIELQLNSNTNLELTQTIIIMKAGEESTKLTLFAFSKDECSTKEDAAKSMENALYIIIKYTSKSKKKSSL